MNYKIFLLIIVFTFLKTDLIFSQIIGDPPGTEITRKIAGTWTMEKDTLITVIQIKDRFNVKLYTYNKREIKSKNLAIKKCTDSPPNATMGYWSNHAIWIKFDKYYRFDYNLDGENLIEVDKTGPRGVYKKEKKNSS